MRVVGTADRWNTIPQICHDTRPSLLLVDVQMPPASGDGLQAARAALDADESLAVVCVSAFDDPALVERALAAGCRGFVTKTADFDEVAAVCQAVLAGESPVFDRRTGAKLAAHYKSRLQQASERSLSARELEVLRLICQGMSNPEIAVRLHLARSSVAGVVSEIFTKLHVSDRASAAATAVRLNLVD